MTQRAGFQTTKEERIGVYDFIARSYSELEQRMSRGEMELRTLRNEIDDLKMRNYINASSSRSRSREMELQIINQIYKPLAASSTIASGILMLFVGIIISPILALPFLFSTAFSAYYWHEQNLKG